MIRYYFEDMPVGSEREIGPRTVTAAEIVEFAREFDPIPFHLDAEAGEASMLGGLAASGWHVCALSMRMTCDAFLLESSGLGSPGISECQWVAPVLAGDTLRGKVVVESARLSASRKGLGLLGLRCELVNQHGELVLRYWNIGLMRTRDAA
ncbi:MAG: MaoC family dehydratase [Nitratireductor sp.]|nr:MaoC family dehydratase [Nitratireductor sp.]